MNQLGKYDFSCDFLHSITNNLRDRIFFDQMNRSHLHPILARHDWSYSTKKNLRCLNSAVKEIIL